MIFLRLLYWLGNHSCSLVKVRWKGKYGYVDSNGHWVIAPCFEMAHHFSEGLAAVRIDGKWGYVDTLGTMVVAPQFDSAEEFHEGLAKVVLQGHKTYIFPSGKVLGGA